VRGLKLNQNNARCGVFFIGITVPTHPILILQLLKVMLLPELSVEFL
jgi:hypothetical protein